MYKLTRPRIRAFLEKYKTTELVLDVGSGVLTSMYYSQAVQLLMWILPGIQKS